jgi:hypothetical protein
MVLQPPVKPRRIGQRRGAYTTHCAPTLQLFAGVGKRKEPAGVRDTSLQSEILLTNQIMTTAAIYNPITRRHITFTADALVRDTAQPFVQE